MLKLALDSSTNSTENIPKDQIRNILIKHKSPSGFNIYNTYYNFIIEYLIQKIKSFNNKLRKEYFLSELKTSLLLDQSDPLVRYYCSKFPEKQFQIKSTEPNNNDCAYTMKPACCANALKMWSIDNPLKYNHIYHEIDDSYRVEKTGSLRSLSRGCYFTMPDYHLILKNNDDTIKANFNLIRELIHSFYVDLLGPNYTSKFYEAYRLYDKKCLDYVKPTFFETPITIEDLTLESDKPYFSIKQEFTYKRLDDSHLQLGTVQVDTVNPVNFNLDAVVLHFSMGSLQRLVELLICENLVPMRGLKVKILDDSLTQSFFKDWDYKTGLLIENKNGNNLSESLSLKSLEERLFFPYFIIYGKNEYLNKKYTVIDRISTKEYVFSKEDLNTFLDKSNLVRNFQIYYTKTFETNS